MEEDEKDQGIRSDKSFGNWCVLAGYSAILYFRPSFY